MKSTMFQIILIGTMLFAVSGSATTSDPEVYESTDIKVIRSWQKFSFKSHLFNCQFSPCCSEYAINVIQSHDFVIGSLLAVNRIVACNPLARYCYDQDANGYLIDNPGYSDFLDRNITIKPVNTFEKLEYGVIISPGVRKLISGRWSDFAVTTSIIGVGTLLGEKRLERGEFVHGSFTLSVVGLIYIADMVWSFEHIKKNKREF